MPFFASESWFFFDASEREIVASSLAWVHATQPGREAALRANLNRLCALAVVIRDSPPIATSWRAMRGDVEGRETLVDLLCRVPDYDVELHTPTLAVIGQAYLVAKINLFKALGYALAEAQGPAPLRTAMDRELAQSIYSKIVEELLTAIVTAPDVEPALKARAAAPLLRLWGDRLFSEVDDVAPLLEAAWEARNKVRPVLGTMLGTAETFRLFQEARDDRFLDYYTGGDEHPADEMAAFEEFLFGLAWEDITALRTHLREHGVASVTPDEAHVILGARHDAWADSLHGPQAIFSNFRRRQTLAAARRLANAPGPRRVAEAYVLLAWLRRGP